MIARSRRLATHAQDRWMISYVDVLTILLIFFLSAAANKFKPPQPVPPKATLPKPTPLVQLEQKLKAEDLNLKLDARGLTISLPQAILFLPGDDRIQAEALPTLEKIADEFPRRPTK